MNMAQAIDAGQQPLPRNGTITTAPSGHPLDPLTGVELAQIVQILSSNGHLGDGVRIASINLVEPEKHAVEALRTGDHFERKALAILLDRIKQTSYEAVIDLHRRSVTSVTKLPSGIQPAIMLDEFGECEQAVLRSPVFRAALA